MKAIINGNERELKTNIAINELLKELNIRPEIVAVEVNFDIVVKEKYSSFRVKEGDKIEIVHFVGGG